MPGRVMCDVSEVVAEKGAAQHQEGTGCWSPAVQGLASWTWVLLGLALLLPKVAKAPHVGLKLQAMSPLRWWRMPIRCYRVRPLGSFNVL